LTMGPQADVALPSEGRLARVQAHAHPKVAPLRPLVASEAALSGQCGADCVLGPREGDKEGIALGVDLLTSSPREGLSEDALVLGQDIRVSAAQVLEQARRPFDVGEEKGDRPAGEIAHSSSFTARLLPGTWLAPSWFLGTYLALVRAGFFLDQLLVAGR